MLGFPAGCDRASCTAYVQWTLVSIDTVQFELEGTAEGWVAVGVSADRVMGGNGDQYTYVHEGELITFSYLRSHLKSTHM